MKNSIAKKMTPGARFQDFLVEKTENSAPFSEICVRKGDIYLVDFKTNIGSEQNGIRPAIVIQNDIGNCFSPTIIVCPISSRKKIFDRTHVVLSPGEGGIRAASVVLCEQIRAIDKSRLVRKIGRLYMIGKMQEINQKISVVLGL